jgi:hypothetical protein
MQARKLEAEVVAGSWRDGKRVGDVGKDNPKFCEPKIKMLLERRKSSSKSVIAKPKSPANPVRCTLGSMF